MPWLWCQTLPCPLACIDALGALKGAAHTAELAVWGLLVCWVHGCLAVLLDNLWASVQLPLPLFSCSLLCSAASSPTQLPLPLFSCNCLCPADSAPASVQRLSLLNVAGTKLL